MAIQEKKPEMKPTYTTPAELAQFEAVVGKTFVRKDGSEKDFAYKVLNITPQFVGVVPEREKIDRFYVLKHSVTQGAGGAILRPVEEPGGAFYQDARTFLEQFAQSAL